jgi:hypothetical protein
MSKRFALFTFCAALTVSLLAAPAFAQEPDPPGTPNSQALNWDPAVVLDATTDWIGNSFSGRNVSEYNSLFHVPLDMDGIYVTPDGNIYTNTTYEEGGRPAMAFNKYGQMISPMNANSAAGPQTYIGPFGGVAVATAGYYNFLSYAPNGTGIGIRDTRTWLMTSYTVNGSSTLNNSQGIWGLAVADNKLYVTEQDENLVEIFDISDITHIRLISSFSVPAPVRIAVDSVGNFWVSHKDDTSYPFTIALGGQGLNYVDQYSGTTGAHMHTIKLAEDAQISALAANRFGALLIADSGPDQNIKIYANLERDPIFVGEFGEKGGSLAGPIPGLTGPLSPHRFRAIMGIGTDAEGNIIVAQGGFGLDGGVGHGVDLQSYTWWGELNWERDGLGFRALGAIDPHSETDFYDAYHHYKIDYSKRGHVDTFVADTYNKFKYPEDVRMSSILGQGEIKYIHGRKFLVARGEIETFLEIYRYEKDSEIPIPCVAFDYGSFQGTGQDFVVQPLNGEFIWRDVNGDGQMTNAQGVWDPDEFFEPNPEDGHRNSASFFIDDNGDVWQQNYGDNQSNLYWRRYYLQGFDQYGSPIYDFQHMATYTVGAGLDFPDLTEVDEVVFDPHASEGGTLFAFGSGGTQLVRYDHWDLTPIGQPKKSTWSALLTTNGDINNYWNGETFTQVGDFIFVDFNSGNAQNNGTWENHYNQVYSAKTGAYVGRIVAGMDVGGMANIGDTDESHSLTSFKRDNDEYVLIREEDFQAKYLLFRWTPPDPLPVPKAGPAPTGVVGVPDDMAFDLTWTLDPNALAYTVSSGPTTSGPFVPTTSGIFGQNSSSVVGLANGKSYGYTKLTVFYSNGTSAESQPVPVSAVQQGTTYGFDDASNMTLSGDFWLGGCTYCYLGESIVAVVQGTSASWNNVVVPKSGTYNLRIYYENGNVPQCVNGNTQGCWGLPAGWVGPTINVTVNGTTTVTSPQMPQTDPSGSFNVPGYVVVPVPLLAGQNNTVQLSIPADAVSGDPNIDRILVPFAPAL